MKFKKQKKKRYPDNFLTRPSKYHTAKRIVHISTIKMIEKNMNNLEIIFKSECDGCNGLAQYNQNFSELISTSTTDCERFMFSRVPLQLQISVNQKKKKKGINESGRC